MKIWNIIIIIITLIIVVACKTNDNEEFDKEQYKMTDTLIMLKEKKTKKDNFLDSISKLPIMKNINEYDVYNSLLDSLYSITYCGTCMKLYDKEERIEKYKIRQTDFKRFVEVFKKDAENYKWIVYVVDSLAELRITERNEYSLTKIKEDGSIFKELIKEYTPNLTATKLRLNKLQQNDISFTPINKFVPKKDFGVYGNEIYFGMIQLSRVKFSKNKRLGIFHFEFMGGKLCGYGEFIFVVFNNGRWEVYQKIGTWVS